MLQHDLQAREIAHQGFQHALDEHRLAVEHVDIGIGHLAMDEERHAEFFHPRQHRAALGEVAHARGGVGGGVGGIELHRGKDAGFEAALDLVGAGVVGQVAGHQRRELARELGRQRGENARAISLGRGNARHRRHQVRHDDGAREAAGGVRQHGFQHRAVAQMHMPIVGPANCYCIHSVSIPSSSFPRKRESSGCPGSPLSRGRRGLFIRSSAIWQAPSRLPI